MSSNTVYYELKYGSIIKSTKNNVIWGHDPDAKRIPEKEAKQKLRARAKEELLKLLKPDDLVYTVCDQVSRSGLRRYIRCFIVKNNQILNITMYVSHLIDYKMKDGALIIDGYGSDMGHTVVYELSYRLFHEHAQDHEAEFKLHHSWL